MTIKASDPTSGSARVFRRCLLVLICLLGFLSPAAVRGDAPPVARNRLTGPRAGAADAPPAALLGRQPSKAGGFDSPQAAGVQLVGQIGGRTQAVVVQDGYTYVGIGPRLVVFDVVDPANPLIVGQTPLLGGLVQRLRVVDHYAYVLAGRLEIVDVSDPSRPRTLGSYASLRLNYDLAVAGGYAYLVGPSAAGGFLEIVDVSNPASARSVGRVDVEGGVGESSVQGVAVLGRYAYVVTALYERSGSYGRLDIIDVSEPAAPRLRGTRDVVGVPYSVAVEGNHTYIATEDSGLHIFDVHDPTRPREVAGSTAVGSGQVVRVARREDLGGRLFAYVTDHQQGGLHILDVSDPTRPTAVAFYDASPTNLPPLDVDVEGNVAYVAEGGPFDYAPYPGGLRVIDISDPAHPNTSGVYETVQSAEQVVVAGDYAYLAIGEPTWEPAPGSIGVIDASDPARLSVTSFYNMGHPPLNLVVTDTRVYVAAWLHGLRILDASDPAQLADLGGSDVPQEPVDVAVRGTHAYVWGDSRTLYVLDVSNPADPVQVGVHETEGVVSDLEVAGDYAYVAHDVGLEIVDISTPARPTRVGSLALTDNFGGPVEIALVEDYAYVVMEAETLRIVDVRDVAHPRQVRFSSGSEFIEAVAASTVSTWEGRRYAFAAVYPLKLAVFDVTDPTQPIEVGFYRLQLPVRDMAADGEHIYLTAEAGGLFVLRFTGPVALPYLRLPLLLRG